MRIIHSFHCGAIGYAYRRACVRAGANHSPAQQQQQQKADASLRFLGFNDPDVLARCKDEYAYIFTPAAFKEQASGYVFFFGDKKKKKEKKIRAFRFVKDPRPATTVGLCPS